ncbi:MAG: phosphoadenylyl-sulfate reductase [Candidatus Schekmanbacteria bacterium]|nr:phosphoadenylyl-sulfate reductase [Candidatus Schekmanbacteria bacterium]
MPSEETSDIFTLSSDFETASVEEILRWAWRQFGPKIAATSSFQTQSVPLLHIMAKTVPDMPVFFLDTGFHFPETLQYRDLLIAEFGLNVQVLTSEDGHEGFLHRHGDLYRTDPDRCCHLNKVEPLNRAMASLRAWVSGIRRDQTAHRENAHIVSRERSGLYKVNPMATWTRRDVWKYIADHHLPEHPLLASGYTSVGCEPCTRPVLAGEDERSGRWAGQQKTECGLHTASIGAVDPNTNQETRHD